MLSAQLNTMYEIKITDTAFVEVCVDAVRNGYQAGTQTQKVWDGVENELHTADCRRRPLYWLLQKGRSREGHVGDISWVGEHQKEGG